MIDEGVIFCICRYLDIGVFHFMVILFNDFSRLGAVCQTYQAKYPPMGGDAINVKFSHRHDDVIK